MGVGDWYFMRLVNTNRRLLANDGRFAHGSIEEEIPVAHRLGAWAGGVARRTVCPERDPRRAGRGVLRRAVLRGGGHREGTDGRGEEPVVLPHSGRTDRTDVAGAGAVPRLFHGHQPPGDLRRAGRDPQALHREADPHAPGRGASAVQRRTQKHADRTH